MIPTKTQPNKQSDIEENYAIHISGFQWTLEPEVPSVREDFHCVLHPVFVGFSLSWHY